MTVEWKDADAVVSALGELYMAKLIGNMPRGATVRLGLTGTGAAPNYQVEVEGEASRLYNGRGHKAWAGDAFADDKLSQTFTKEELTAPFVRAFRSSRGMSVHRRAR